MKPRLAAALSITGVLVAGTAAAVVNTRVLDSEAESSGVPVATGAPTTSLDTTTSTSTGAPTLDTTMTTVASTPPATVAPVPTSGQQTFSLGRAGTVTLAAIGDTLSIVRVDAAAGWEIHDAENESSNSVRVRLRTDGSDVRFEASLVLGVINSHLEEEYEDDD